MLKILQKTIGITFIFLSLQGCTGKVITKNLTLDEINRTGAEFAGIHYYLPAHFIETSKTTVLTNEKGEVLATVSGKETGITCISVDQKKLVVYADYKNPKLISYDHGVLETYTFNVDLNDNGTLSAVKNVSTPDKGETLKNITESAVNIAKLAAPTPALVGGSPACNSGLVFVSITKL